jgi:uncharacterized membrane protein
MKEDRKKEEISKRSDRQRRQLKVRRIIMMILSLIVIIAGWGAIVYLSIYTNYIT